LGSEKNRRASALQKLFEFLNRQTNLPYDFAQCPLYSLVSWGIWHRQWRFVNDYREA
jgi:hypothetical protein